MLRTIPRATIAMMALATLFACGDDESKAEEVMPALIGVVVDVETGAPIEGATVRRYQSTSSDTQTDENGAFEFTDATATEAALITVSADGYLFARKTITATDLKQAEEPAEDGTEPAMEDGIEFSDGILVVTIEMMPEPKPVPDPEVRIIGVVVDNATNMPIEGATVTRHQSTSSQQMTASDGSFVFEDALYAPATLTVEAEGYTFAEMKVAVSDFSLEGVVPTAPAMGMMATVTGEPTKVASNASANVTIQLTLAPPMGVQIERNITGHVFLQGLTPAVGAEVMLVQGGLVHDSTKTDDEGAFGFEDVPFMRVDTQYQLIVAPFDDDGDGWADTGVDVTNGVCLYGITQGDCPDPDNGPINGVAGLSNVVLRLEAPNHSILANNACNAGFIRKDQSLYLLFDTSVDRGKFDAVLLGPNGAELGTDLSWTGSYLVRIAPDDELTESEDGDDVYRLQIRSVVFDDGFVLYDPTNASDLLSCSFQVGAKATYLESPEPRLWRNPKEALASVDSDEVRYYDATGKLLRTTGLGSLEIAFPHVAGAVDYSIRAKQTIGDDREWSEIATRPVGPEWSPAEVLATINLNSFGLLGEPLGFGNQIEIMIKPIDSNGHVAPETGAEPTLKLRDAIDPFLTGTSWTPDTSMVADNQLVGDLRVDFSGSMNVNSVPENLMIHSGRVSAVSLDNATVYWGSSSPSSASSSQLYLEGVTFTVATGKDLKVQTNANNGDSLLETAELPSGYDLKGYAVGHTIGVWDASADSVFYTSVAALNTAEGALGLSGGSADVDDVIFDPRTRTDRLTAEAREGADVLKVNDASKFFVGQQLVVRTPSNSSTVSVMTIDTAAKTLTLTGTLGRTWPVGASVIDAQLDSMGDYNLRSATTINSGNQVLISPTSLASGTNMLVFNNFAPISGVTVGDTILIDADGDDATLADRASAVITSIATIETDGSSIQDGNMVSVTEIGIGSVKFLGDSPNPLPLDPPESYVLAMGDVLEVENSYASDSSGNDAVLSALKYANMVFSSIGNLTIFGD